VLCVGPDETLKQAVYFAFAPRGILLVVTGFREAQAFVANDVSPWAGFLTSVDTAILGLYRFC